MVGNDRGVHSMSHYWGVDTMTQERGVDSMGY